MRASLCLLSAILCGGDRDLCFDGRGSLEELSALIQLGDFMCWWWKVWLSSEAAAEVSGEQSVDLQIGLTE